MSEPLKPLDYQTPHAPSGDYAPVLRFLRRFGLAIGAGWFTFCILGEGFHFYRDAAFAAGWGAAIFAFCCPAIRED